MNKKILFEVSLNETGMHVESFTTTKGEAIVLMTALKVFMKKMSKKLESETPDEIKPMIKDLIEDIERNIKPEE